MSTPDTPRVRDTIIPRDTLIDGLSSVKKALRLMDEGDVDALVIDKRDPDDEYGLISMSMIAARVFAPKRNPKRVSVYEVMEKPTVILPANMQLRYAIRLLSRLNTRHAIVTEEDHMIGHVTLRDLVLAEFHAQFPKEKS